MNLRRAQFQKTLGYVLFLPLGSWVIFALKYGFRYKIIEMRRLRREFRTLLKDPRPLLICANHLTYIDSLIMIYAFGSHLWYFRNYRALSWNLPAKEYQKNRFFNLICYLYKCIFIDRKGSVEHQHQILQLAGTLLKKGEVLTLFPEGRRSTTGRFDDSRLAYGVGKVVTQLNECRVLCVYLRADTQERASQFPKKYSKFKIKLDLLNFSQDGVHGPKLKAAHVTREIAAKIQSLETAYFDEVQTQAQPGNTLAQSQ